MNDAYVNGLREEIVKLKAAIFTQDEKTGDLQQQVFSGLPISFFRKLYKKMVPVQKKVSY